MQGTTDLSIDGLSDEISALAASRGYAIVTLGLTKIDVPPKAQITSFGVYEDKYAVVRIDLPKDGKVQMFPLLLKIDALRDIVRDCAPQRKASVVWPD